MDKHVEFDCYSLLKGISDRLKVLEDSMILQKEVFRLKKDVALKGNRIQTLENEISKMKKPAFGQDEHLHQKVDKLIRLYSECADTQKKIMKQISNFNKSCTNTTKPKVHATSPQKPEPMPVINEYEWANGLSLIGDELWKNFKESQDFDSLKKQMPTARINSKEGQNLFGLFDDKRGQIVVPLPAASRTFVLSVGARDLREKSLINLKKGSLEEVRKHNFPILYAKVCTLKSLVQKILNISPSNSVIVVLPPRGYDEIVEVHLHWEELVKDSLKTIPWPRIKILHLPFLIKKTQTEFDGDMDFKTNWFGTKRPELSSPLKLGLYGTKQLFDELRRTILAQHPTAIGMDGDWPVDSESCPSAKVSSEICPRCIRVGHSSSKCKSKDKVCFKCGIMGHFVEIHEVTDVKIRETIVKGLGIDIFKDSSDDTAAKKPRLEPLNPMIGVPPPPDKFNDWYN
ncbi:uncharacterized protein [Lepeophtheirus salmonis]|nr:uncharacterized protein LOC121129487 [Lepeophtheirus salmonis]